MKKIVIIAGMMAMAGALFLASPVSAQDNEAVTAVLNDDGTVTVTGTGWNDAPNLYVTICKSADPSAENGGISATNATTLCTDIMTDGFSTNPTDRDGAGGFTYTIPASKVGDVPDEGYVILVGEFAAGSQWSATTVVKAAAEEEPAAAEATDEGAGGDDDMSGDDSMDDASGGDDTASTTMADDMDSTEESFGLESGLLAVIAASVVIAGLFAVGIGRRISRRS